MVVQQNSFVIYGFRYEFQSRIRKSSSSKKIDVRIFDHHCETKKATQKETSRLWHTSLPSYLVDSHEPFGSNNTMGTTSSSTAPRDAYHQDLEFLADRFPFGDAELHTLYEAYLQIMSQAEERTTFLQDWAVQATLHSHRQGWKKRAQQQEEGEEERMQREARAQERRMLLQVVEAQILQPDVGNTLYRVTCSVEGDVLLYPTEKSDTTTPTTTVVDEFTRRTRLEQTFAGFTRMGRKGAMAATQTIFDMVATKHECGVARVHAMSLVKLSYSLALATAFLEAAANEDDEGMAEFTAHDTKSDEALQAMANSMLAKAESRLQRSNILQTMDGDNEQALQAIRDGYIEWDDLWEWTEDVGPLMASILPSFVQTWLFPDQPTPPSRTAYKFPRLSHPSVFFETPTSSLLFKFGCLSASLSGTYHRLYTSASDGLSFNRLLHALVRFAFSAHFEHWPAK